ncbi:ABC transporter substrate-binding protein [Propionibacterium australiense]|uniref:ABC transporter substrate-binding protein n=1 Tax=Propionibacterium australiense TaxID=119981 RepID=A0A383S2U8_9ACTN|nr:ABC transporter substrate-binding protein [Propionibacterium australiense]RLP06452.1 ABC transporter substrate-binding protein [Propionibacterium australiense]RLP11603.1 ABC transporter substrate-binding protein [Propionibacterium australiense]SYZ32325.1 SsuA/THI5-like [Propionibacterium australiense]VEH90435.1 Putative thiamine biosynthesis protein HI_0357 [Propionibacterium australiense]
MTHSRFRRLWQALLLAMGLTLVVSACSGSESPGSGASDGDEIVVGLTYTADIQFSPFYVAAEKGYFTDEGLTVTLRHHGTSEPLLGALQSGDEDVVYAGGDEMMVNRAQGVDVVDFATIYQSYPGELIVPADSAIGSLADLKGHSIGVPGEFGETWYTLLALLDEAGLSRDDVDIQSIGFTQQSALMTGKVDAVVGFANNDAVQFRQAGFEIREIAPSEGTPLVGLGLGATASTLSERRDDLTGLLNALERAADDCASNPDEAVELSARYITTLTDDEQRAKARATLEATNALYGDDFGKQDSDSWAAMSAFLMEKGITAEAVDPDQAHVTLS